MKNLIVASALLFCTVAVLPALAAKPAGKPAGKPHPGQAIYKQQCAACHGEAGKPAVPKSPDFTSKAYQKRAKDAKLIKVTTNGAGDMPGFKGQLKPDRIKAVVAYIRTLGK